MMDLITFDYKRIGSIKDIQGDMVFKDTKVEICDLPNRIEYCSDLSTGLSYHSFTYPAQGYIPNVYADKFEIYAAKKDEEVVALKFRLSNFDERTDCPLTPTGTNQCEIKNNELNIQLLCFGYIREYGISVANGIYDIYVYNNDSEYFEINLVLSKWNHSCLSTFTYEITEESLRKDLFFLDKQKTNYKDLTEEQKSDYEECINYNHIDYVDMIDEE